MRVKQYEDMWYYETGFFADHTQAIYFPKKKELRVISLKHLPRILRHLQQEFNLGIITLRLDKSFAMVERGGK